jgi:hypothetical protein
VDRRAGGAGAELEEVGELILIEGFDDAPEPLDDLVVGVVLSLVIGVGVPVLIVDVGHSVDKHFQLVWFENSQHVHGDDLVESLAEVADRPLHFLLADGLDAA